MPFAKKFPSFPWWLALILVVLVSGVAGYVLIEGFNFLDAVYMVLITITTIGYHEVRPLSDAGKIFNAVFIVASFTTFTYLVARLTQYIVSGDLSQSLLKKRLMQQLAKKNGHVIICGFGRNGQQAAKTLRAHKIDFVVVEKKRRHHAPPQHCGAGLPGWRCHGGRMSRGRRH